MFISRIDMSTTNPVIKMIPRDVALIPFFFFFQMRAKENHKACAPEKFNTPSQECIGEQKRITFEESVKADVPKSENKKATSNDKSQGYKEDKPFGFSKPDE